jgi:ADP-ribose pyrophosphatase YjhB (NUDIX family)
MGREFPTQPVVAVGAVVLRRNATESWEVLLVKRANPPSQGEWSLPGGVVELGERLEQAVLREVLEETGLVVEPVAMVEVLDSIVQERAAGSRVRFHYVLVDYVCRVLSGEAASATDALAVTWRTVQGLQESGEFALRPKTLEVIRKAARLLETPVPGQ